MNKPDEKKIRSFVTELSHNQADVIATIDDGFKQKVKEYIDGLGNKDWAKNVTMLIAKNFFEAGYDAAVAIDVDDCFNNGMLVAKTENSFEDADEIMGMADVFLDIFAIDRKAKPMVFDKRIKDRVFVASKAADIIQCKLYLVCGALEGLTPGEVYDKFPEEFNKIVERKNSYELNV